MKQRLSKVLAAHGIASRRESEHIIAAGRVKVNGQTVVSIVPVDTETDTVTVDGKPLKPPTLVYYAFNKPFGVVTTMQDERRRKKVADYFTKIHERVYPVGRLDATSSGLLFMTNDGDFAQKVGHPRFQIDKVYKVEVYGTPSEEALDRLRKGVRLKEGKTSPSEISVLYTNQKHKTTTLLVTIHEGRHRQVRRMFEIVRHTVKSLQRVQIGPVQLGDLSSGQYRPLTAQEIETLKNL